MSKTKDKIMADNKDPTTSTGLPPPTGENSGVKKTKNKDSFKSGKKKKKKPEKDFTPSDLADFNEKLDRKETSFLRNLATKRYTKKITRGIIIERLITISLILIILTMGVVYSVSYTYVNSGYGINVVSDQRVTKAVSLSEDDNFRRLSVGLKAAAITSLDNISYSWLDTDLDDRGGGNHNGDNYISYTFYVLNTGNVDLIYSSILSIKNSTLEVETAVRVEVFRNGVPTIYTHTYEAGIDEEEGIDETLENYYGITVEEFYSENVITSNTVTLLMGDYNRYTVVVWLEGEDPDCVNDKFSSELQMVWNISVLDEDP